MQSVMSVWYLTLGHAILEAATVRRNLGPWDTEWSCPHRVRMLRITTMATTINAGFADNNDCQGFIRRVKNYLFYVVYGSSILANAQLQRGLIVRSSRADQPEPGQDGSPRQAESRVSGDPGEFATSINTRATRGKVASPELSNWHGEG